MRQLELPEIVSASSARLADDICRGFVIRSTQEQTGEQNRAVLGEGKLITAPNRIVQDCAGDSRSQVEHARGLGQFLGLSGKDRCRKEGVEIKLRARSVVLAISVHTTAQDARRRTTQTRQGVRALNAAGWCFAITLVGR